MDQSKIKLDGNVRIANGLIYKLFLIDELTADDNKRRKE